MTNWIEKELNQQTQQSNERQLLANLSREFWVSAAAAIQSDAEEINANYLPQFDTPPITINPESSSLSGLGDILIISSDIIPSYRIELAFDSEQKTISVKTESRKKFGETKRSSRRKLDFSLDKEKHIVLREGGESVTLEELSQSVLIPLVKR